MPAFTTSEMILKFFLVVFIFVWGSAEIFQNIQQRKRDTHHAEDKGSLILLYTGISLGYSIGIPFGFSPYGRIDWGYPFLMAAGFLLILVGLCIRAIARHTLASYFTYEIGLQTDHRLIEKGLYRNIRHSGYLGQLLIFLGIGCGFSNWISLLGLLAPVSIAFGWRIKVEEEMLRKHFPKEYDEYRKRTWGLIPWIY